MESAKKRAGRYFGVGLLCLIALGGFAFWQSVEHADKSSKMAAERLDSDPGSLTVIRRIDSRQLTTFAQLKTSPEGLPSSLRRIIRRPPLGANWALTQRLPVHVKGRFWAVPAKGVICIVGQRNDKVIEMTCTTTKAALLHGVAIVSLDQAKTASTPAPRLTVGMAPDGLHTVVIHTGSKTTIGAVANGVFAMRDMATDPPDELTFR